VEGVLDVGVWLGWPQSFWVLLSFSVKRSSGTPSHASV
jgi:hypothetical protein